MLALNLLQTLKKYMSCTLIWLNGTHLTHMGFVRLDGLDGIAHHALVTWPFWGAYRSKL